MLFCLTVKEIKGSILLLRPRPKWPAQNLAGEPRQGFLDKMVLHSKVSVYQNATPGSSPSAPAEVFLGPKEFLVHVQ